MRTPFLPFPLLTLLACNPQAATRVIPPDTGSPAEEGGGDSAEPPGDTGGEEVSPFDRDDDGDGWTENQGDCDDADPSVHPGAEDACDGVDQDCDGELDEDAAASDPYEPDDASCAELGELGDGLSLQAWLHNDQDVDRYCVEVDDPWWSSFGFTVSVDELPEGGNFVLEVGRVVDGAVEAVDDCWGSGSLELEIDGTPAHDDGGTYQVSLSVIGGADCSRAYLLSIAP